MYQNEVHKFSHQYNPKSSRIFLRNTFIVEAVNSLISVPKCADCKPSRKAQLFYEFEDISIKINVNSRKKAYCFDTSDI